MTVSCPECRSVFRVDPSKVPATGVRARCSVCGGVISIAGGTLPISVTPASQSAVSMPPARPTPQRPFSAAGSLTPVVATPVPVAPTAPVAAAVSPVSPVLVSPRAASPTGSPAESTPPTAQSAPLPMASATPELSPPQPARLPSVTPRPTPAFGAAPVAMRTPPMGMAATTASPTPRRSVNPFLNADPGQRARRLARALVSDLVAYHPQKREEGLREGTLRQLFREDIKKSYEEYLEQVGRESAEGSPHFQEALNEILGGGRKLF